MASKQQNDLSDSDGSNEFESNMQVDQKTCQVSEAQLTCLYERLTANIYDYDAHVGIIAAMKALGDLEALRQARQTMADIFPLTEAMWIDWVSDEMPLAANKTLKLELIQTFQRSVTDYLSIPLWKMYLDYVLEEYSESLKDGTNWLSTDQVQKICSAARKATDHHYTKSHVIWNTIKDFHLEQLEIDSSFENVEKMRKMFLDRLKQPHQEIDKTLESYSPFESQYNQKEYFERLKLATQICNKTKKDQKYCESLERKLEQSEYSLDAFNAYLSFEKKQANGGNIKFIQTLYERALSLHCLDPTLWNSYLIYMTVWDKLPTTLVSIAERAVRNCMTSGPLWCHLLRIKTIARKPRSDVTEDYQRAIRFLSMAGDFQQILAVAMCHCEVELKCIAFDDTYTPDTVRAVFQETAMYLDAITNIDPLAKFQRFWAKAEEYFFKDVSTARNIYHIVVKRVPFLTEAWLEFVQFEIRHDNISKARSLLKQAALQNTNTPEQIYEQWIEFERIRGGLDTLYEALDKIHVLQARLAKVRDAKSTGVDDQYHAAATCLIASQNQHAISADSASPLLVENTKKRSVVENEAEAHSKRAKIEEAIHEPSQEPHAGKLPGSLAEYKVINNSMAGNMVYLSKLSQNTTESTILKHFGVYGQVEDLFMQPNEESGELEAFVEFSKAELVRKIVLDGPISINGTVVTPCRCRPSQMVWDFKQHEEKTKIYVSNLSPQMQKRQLRHIFSEFGKIREIRLQNRKTMAFAYIDFEKEEDAIKSLKMNQAVIEKTGDRKIGVAISDPTKKMAKEIDHKKLYVSNLSHTMTEDDLQELFSKFGEISALRVVRMPNGNSKGIAFVEYNQEDHAKEAMTLNGTMVDGRLIVVSVSDPNLRKGKSTMESARTAGKEKTQLNATSSSTAATSKDTKSDSLVKFTATNSMAFTPRAVRAPKKRGRSSIVIKAKPDDVFAAGTALTNNEKRPANKDSHESSKTQNDFRNMLLNKK
ncbi:Splicing factor [Batrachochytrium dendrobatidis]|nr:Splicing factor [Batrachochytrium dendrobatidis]